MKRTASFATFLLLILSRSPPRHPSMPRCYTARSSSTSRDHGGAVPGADVTIAQTETDWTRSGTSNEVGAATFATVPPGTYKIRVTLTGFKEYVTTGVRVSADNVMRVSRMLVVGQMTDTVTVTAGVAVLQTDRADVRTEIPAAQLANLPVPVGRNYQNLFITVPGVSPPENMHSVAVNPARGLAFSSGGTTRNANAIRIEGAISNNLWLPHVAAYVPALEAIETVSVDDEQLRRGSGIVGRHVGERADQERHERAARLGVRVSLQRRP